MVEEFIQTITKTLPNRKKDVSEKLHWKPNCSCEKSNHIFPDRDSATFHEAECRYGVTIHDFFTECTKTKRVFHGAGPRPSTERYNVYVLDCVDGFECEKNGENVNTWGLVIKHFLQCVFPSLEQKSTNFPELKKEIEDEFPQVTKQFYYWASKHTK